MSTAATVDVNPEEDTIDLKIHPLRFLKDHLHKEKKRPLTKEEELQFLDDQKKRIEVFRLNTSNYIAPEVREISNSDPLLDYNYNLTYRASQGYKIACRLFAFLSGVDAYDSEWPREYKECANMISREIGIASMYGDLYDNDLTKEDYSINTSDRPIITQGIIMRALSEFPVKELPKDIDKIFEATPVDPDLFVDVMDVEEKIVEGSATAIKENEADIHEEDAKPAEEVKDGDKVVPIEFRADHMGLTKWDSDTDGELRGPTKAQLRDFTNKFSQFLGGRKFQLNRIPSGAIEADVDNGDGDFWTYWIDPGLCVGDGYNVLGNYETGNQMQPFDTIPVNETKTDLLQKIFSNKFYILTPDEVKECSDLMFENQRIYNVFDMSNMENRLNKLKTKDIELWKKFGKKLSFIISVIPQDQLGRMRFDTWKGIDAFTLVSDEKVVSPFPGQTMDYTTGVRVAVEGDIVHVYFNGSESSYEVDYSKV